METCVAYDNCIQRKFMKCVEVCRQVLRKKTCSSSINVAISSSALSVYPVDAKVWLDIARARPSSQFLGGGGRQIQHFRQSRIYFCLQ